MQTVWAQWDNLEGKENVGGVTRWHLFLEPEGKVIVTRSFLTIPVVRLNIFVLHFEMRIIILCQHGSLYK